MRAARLRRRSRLLRPSSVRALWWAGRALRRARRDLPADGVRTQVTGPPSLPAAAEIGVRVALRTAEPTCLERSLVLQAWLAAHGAEIDVVIGVPRDSATEFGPANAAHAWLATEAPERHREQYSEICRIGARRPFVGR